MIQAENLTKCYDDLTAIRKASLNVDRCICKWLLSTQSAGKI